MEGAGGRWMVRTYCPGDGSVADLFADGEIIVIKVPFRSLANFKVCSCLCLVLSLYVCYFLFATTCSPSLHRPRVWREARESPALRQQWASRRPKASHDGSIKILQKLTTSPF